MQATLWERSPRSDTAVKGAASKRLNEATRRLSQVGLRSRSASVRGMGEIPAAIVVAGILQKGTAVTSAGGYLRELTRKAKEGEFSVGPMLMALISARKRDKKRA